MKTLIKITLSLALLVAGESWGASTADKPCGKQDLLGTWEIVTLDAIKKPEHANAPLYYKYQKRIFRPDGKMRHYVGAVPTTPEQEKEFEKTPNNVEFDMVAGGVVTVRVANRETDRFRCLVTGTNEVRFVWPESGEATLIHRFKKKN